MVLAWTRMVLGIALTTNSLWLIALLPLEAAFAHSVNISMEARFLEEYFVENHLRY